MFLLLVLVWVGASIPLLNNQIFENIFHTNKIYLLYVCNTINASSVQMMESYCVGDHLCAIINGDVEKGQLLKDFMGGGEEYFAILNSQGTKKYILPINSSLTTNDLLIFQSSFEQGKLQPFLKSEELPQELYPPCMKIVGKTLDHFLSLGSRVKVLMLYRQMGTCELCGQMLRMFGDIADKMYHLDLVRFGYMDIFKNDHKLIHNYALPHFLIFTPTQQIQIPGDKVESLPEIIGSLVVEEDKFSQELDFEGTGTTQL